MRSIALELSVLGLGMAVLLLGLFVPRERHRAIGYAAVFGLMTVFLASFARPIDEVSITFHGQLLGDGLGLLFKRLFIAAAVVCLLMVMENDALVGNRLVEYITLMLMGLAGLMLAASAFHLVLMYLSLELATVCFYGLVAFRPRLERNLEAGLKYFVMSALASAIMLFGIALVYARLGTLSFEALRLHVEQAGLDPLSGAGLILILIGLGFKLGVVPFHVWVPDVYQGAPASTAAYLAVASKGAGLIVVIRLLYQVLWSLRDEWRPAMATVGLLTMGIGTLCAVPQRSLRRVMGYSSILNAGFFLVAVSSAGRDGLMATLFYVVAYAFATMGVFSVFAFARFTHVPDENLALRELYSRYPVLAFGLGAYLMSLAGLPPFGGFIGKIQVLRGIMTAGGYGAVPLAGGLVVLIVIGFYFYLRFVRVAYLARPEIQGETVRVGTGGWMATVFCLVVLLWLGLMPNGMMNLASYTVDRFLALY